MAKTWATSGVDLHVDVGSTRVRASLEGGAAGRGPERAAARRGSGCRRRGQLAADLGLAREHGRGRLRPAGRRGLARRAAGLGHAGRPARRRDPGRRRRPAGHRGARRRATTCGRARPTSRPSRASAWLAAAAPQRCAAPPCDAFGYGDPRGRPELREALAGYLARARGVRADPGPDRRLLGLRAGPRALLGRRLRRRGGRVAWPSRPTACDHRRRSSPPRACGRYRSPVDDGGRRRRAS